jgi:hypothetical protein
MRRDLLQARHRGDDAIDVLMRGHMNARELISRYQMLQRSPGFGPRARRALADELCAELAVHLHIEEELFYPALRDAGAAGDTELALAEVEHECLRSMLSRVQSMSPDEPLFDARIGVISEMFDLHLHREVAEMYPLARRSDIDLALLGEALQLRRDELLEQVENGMGIHFENEGNDPVGLPPR